jgi:hypothetical protein
MSPYIHKKVSVLAIEYPLEGRVLRAVAIAIVFLAFLYVYLVSASILHIIARKEAVKRSTSTETAIASMEQRYFTLSQNVNQQAVSSLGLAPVESTSYVYRSSAVGIVDTAAQQSVI